MNDKVIHLEIDGFPVSVPFGTTILNAAESIGIEIPTLCYLKDLAPGGSCRFCVVEADCGVKRGLVPSCSEPCADGMKVRTRTPRVTESRRFILNLLLSRHLNSCFSCDRSGECKNRQIPFCNYDKNCFTCPALEDCKLRKYCIEYGVNHSTYPSFAEEQPICAASRFFVYDPNLCILCRRCQRTCDSLPGRGLISVLNRGFGTALDMPFASDRDAGVCKSCGKCVEACPTGALSKRP